VLAALLLVPFGLSAEQEASPSDSMQAFNMWLTAHNSGELAQLEAFNNKHDKEADVQWFVDFRESMGLLQLLEIRTDTPTKVDVLVLSEWGNAMVATIEFKQNDDLQISNMQFEGVPTPDAFKPAPMAREVLEQEAARRLDGLEAEGMLSGSFLMSWEGQQEFEWNGGLADREAVVPVSTATRFRMASLGKMFTAGAITLRQLLNHTSGTGEVFGDKFPKISASLKTHQDYRGAFASTPLEFEAGTKERYSN